MQESLDPWITYVDDLNEKNPAGMNNCKWAGDAFTWMKTEKTMISSAVQGVIISVIFAFFILVISTMNIIISLFSAVCIALIVVFIVAIMQLNGWEFGVAESIAVVVLIGFSVDYVVHLANHYVESAFTKRQRRIAHALSEMGVSIFSGAVTTVLSGAVLILCSSTLFDKFSIIIVATIFVSIVMSLGVFSSMVHIAGPNGTFGDLNYWVVRPIKNLIKKVIANAKKDKKGKEESFSDTNKEETDEDGTAKKIMQQ